MKPVFVLFPGGMQTCELNACFPHTTISQTCWDSASFLVTIIISIVLIVVSHTLVFSTEKGSPSKSGWIGSSYSFQQEVTMDKHTWSNTPCGDSQCWIVLFGSSVTGPADLHCFLGTSGFCVHLNVDWSELPSHEQGLIKLQPCSLQVIPQGVAPTPCIPCCLVVTDTKLLTCHQDCQTSFFRSLGSADVSDVTTVNLEADKEYCVIVSDDLFSASWCWIIWFYVTIYVYIFYFIHVWSPCHTY